MSSLSTILNELECPVCLEYMVEEISLCIEGHSLCKSCKNKLRPTCPICKSNIVANRNYTLEKIAASLNYPCRNQDCNKEFNAKEINDHERNCDSGDFKCGLNFVGCDWRGKFKEIKTHIETTHSGYIKTWNPVRENQVYVCFYLEYTFIITFKFANEITMYSGMYIGPRDNARNFLLNVEFEDQTGKGYKLYGAAPCIPWCNLDDAFSEEQIIFSYDMMHNFFDSRKDLYASTITITKI